MLWFVRRHPDTPLVAKVLCVFAVAYALSPIDLIPDFIPVLGYVDDVLLLPAMIWLAVRLLPTHVIETCREQAEKWILEDKAKPTSYVAAIAIVIVWMSAIYFCWQLFAHRDAEAFPANCH
ncbi:YkvA family protein [Pusillimonas sp.]|uniref:YkvA family protein n=1 Tax=Pusillimonas sp. TaxID=3040095 RepID=UPI0037C996D5